MAWFKKLGHAVTTHPWLVIGAWIAAGVVVLALSPQIVSFTSNNNSSFLPSSYESVQASQVAAKYFPAQAQASGLIVVNRPDGNVLSTSDQQKVGGLAETLMADKIPSVTSVTTSPMYLSMNQKVQLVQVVFSGQSGDPGPNQAVVTVRDKTDQYLAGSGLVGVLTGNAAISVDSTNAFDKAEKIITIATVLLILLLLGIVFRSLLIAVLPIFVIGFVHQVAQAVTADLADWFHFEVGPELAPLLVVVMFGVGTDYIVFLLFRYREHLAKGESSGTAAATSITKVGEVIVSAAATVIAAFAALLVASLESLRTLAPGLIVGIFLMLLAAMTLVPAILSLLGRHLFWPTSSPPTHLGPANPVRADRRRGRPSSGPGAGRLDRGSHRAGLWRPRLHHHLQPAGRAAVVDAVTGGLQHHGVGLPGRGARSDPGLRGVENVGPPRRRRHLGAVHVPAPRRTASPTWVRLSTRPATPRLPSASC